MISKLSRRDLLTTAPLVLAGTALAQHQLPIQTPGSLPPQMVTELYAQLGTVVTNAKAHTLRPQDLAALRGMLTMVFPIWVLDGTLDKLQAGYNPRTFVEPPDLRVNLSALMKEHGIALEVSDFGVLDRLPEMRGQVPTGILKTMEQILEMQDLQVKQADMARTVVYGNVFQYYYKKVDLCTLPFMPIALSAGMTAALGWFNPIVVAVFGTMAALALIGDYLFC